MNSFESIDFDNTRCHEFFKTSSKCYLLKDAYVVKKCNNTLIVIHNGKQFVRFLKRDYFFEPQALEKYQNVYYEDVNFSVENVSSTENNMFLLYDEWAPNLFYGFYDVLPKCWYFNQLKKSISDLKLGYIRNDSVSADCLKFLYNPSELTFSGDCGSVIHVKNLYIPAPYHLSYGWIDIPDADRYFESFDLIRDRVKKQTFLDEQLYISRQDTKIWYHDRKMLNEIELINKLSDRGYKSIELLSLSMEDKAAIFKGTSKVVTQSGANCGFCIFSNSNTKNVFIRHPIMGDWYDKFYENIANRYGLNIKYIFNSGILRKDISYHVTDSCNVPWELKDVDKTCAEIDSL
jgi:hypothetical protein